MRYLPYGIITGIVVAIILSIRNIRRKKKGKQYIEILPFTSFFMYLAIILFITFLSREAGSRKGVDLQLFSTWGINQRNNAYVIENILLFIPYGFVCAFAWKSARNIFMEIIYGFFTSLTIETMQLITQRGYFQIDDIITNTMGSIIGYFIFRCIEFLKQKKTLP